MTRLKFLVQINHESLPEDTPPNHRMMYADLASVDLELGKVTAREEIFGASPSRARRLVRVGDSLLPYLTGGAGWTATKALLIRSNDLAEVVFSTGFYSVSPGPSIEPRFLTYLLSSTRVLSGLEAASTGVTMQGFTAEDLGSVRVWLPPWHAQFAIADYLDTETARIDALIAKKQQVVALLDERFRSQIDEAIASFERVRLKRLVWFQEGPGIMADDFRDEGVPLVRVAGIGGPFVTLDGCNYLDPEKVQVRWSHFALQEGDYVISASASMGIASLVDESTAGAIPYTGLIRFKPAAAGVDMGFVRYFLISTDFTHQIDQLKTGTAIQHFGPSHLNQITIPYLRPHEQRRVSAVLHHADSLRQRATLAMEQQISLLRESRQALITAAVTGELQIPGVAT